MASTLTETFRSARVNHLPPSGKQSADVLGQKTGSTSTASQHSNTPGGTHSSQLGRYATLQSNAAHNGASASSQQPGLSSLAVAALAGGKMKEDPQSRLVGHTSHTAYISIVSGLRQSFPYALRIALCPLSHRSAIKVPLITPYLPPTESSP